MLRRRTLATLAGVTVAAVLIPASTAGAATVIRLTPVATLQPGSITKALNLSPHDVRLIEGGLAIVVLLALALVLRIRRRRRGDATAAPKTETHAFPSTDEAWRGSGLIEDQTGTLPTFHAGEVVLPTVAPGWHPIEGDRSKLRYWDGARWTARLEWDGQKWAEPDNSVPA